jgi:peroxiredoxin
LAVVQEQYRLLKRLGVKVVAASTDGEAAARKSASDLSLDFPVGFGVTSKDIETLGAWTGDRKGETIMQPAEFILKPDGEVAASLYGTTQLGRMNPHEVAVFVKDRL